MTCQHAPESIWSKYGAHAVLLVTLFLVVSAFVSLRLLNDQCSQRENVGYTPPNQVTEPHVPAPKESKQEDKRSKTNDGKQSSASLSVNALNGEQKAANDTDHTREEPENWWRKFSCDIRATDFAIALLTLILSSVTALLWWSTHKLWLAGERQIAALKDNERPWIVVESYILAKYENITEATSGFLVDLQLINLGRAPAIIDECLLCFSRISDLPLDKPDYSRGIRVFVKHTCASGEMIRSRSGIGPSPDIGVAFIDGGVPYTRWAVYGRITYREMHGDEHHTGFAVEVLMGDVMDHIRIGGSAYEYQN
jgi:hypothetical protein